MRFELIGDDSLPEMDLARFTLDVDTLVAQVTEMVEAVFRAKCGYRADCFHISTEYRAQTAFLRVARYTCD